MANMLEYKCPCCGGAIEFNSSVQKMKCPYCDTEFEMETLKELDKELKEELPDEMNWDIEEENQWQNDESSGMRSYVCNSCGGEIIGDENTAATSCPFCGNPVVMMGKVAGDLKPDYVIPFKLDKKAAKANLKKHLEGKRFLPKIFKDENHIDEIKGIYVPFWLFDADVNANIRYKATKIRTWSDKNFDYTETSYFAVRRGGKIAFDHVPVDGSSSMANELMESLEPFDFSEAVDFQTAYLAGYLADKYDATAEECISRANERIRNSTSEAFASTVKGYASVMPEATNLQLQNGKAKYALYPVWILNTTWNGEKYLFAMNGQNGRFVGDLPCDKGAFWKTWSILTVIFSILIYGLCWLLH
ncbi:MAG: hypothetical protein ACI4C1_02555 [Lachnospiraceae bacterium]